MSSQAKTRVETLLQPDQLASNQHQATFGLEAVAQTITTIWQSDQPLSPEDVREQIQLLNSQALDTKSQARLVVALSILIKQRPDLRSGQIESVQLAPLDLVTVTVALTEANQPPPPPVNIR